MKRSRSNQVSIIRKRPKNNIPGFSDPTAKEQNEWFKIADFSCVEFLPGETAKVYDEEHDENYTNQSDVNSIELYFESWRQKIKPPYDIKRGDYVAFHQDENIYFYRIVKTSITSMFVGCCVVELGLNVTNPREAQYLLECGLMAPLKDEDLVGGVIQEEYE